MFYRIKLNSLQLGDIILSTDPQSLKSWIIRKYKRGPFSHASLYIGQGQVIEADSSGVHLNVLRLWCFAERDCVRIYRVKPLGDKPKWSQSLSTVVEEAMSLWLHGYNHWGAIGFPLADLLGKNVLSQDGKYFCSQVVACAYAAIGFRFNAKEPNAVHPEDIRSSEGLLSLDSGVCLEELPQSLASRLMAAKPQEQFIDLQRVLSEIVNEFRQSPPGSFDEAEAVFIKHDYADLDLQREWSEIVNEFRQSPPGSIDEALAVFIKHGYANLPRLYSEIGRRSFGVSSELRLRIHHGTLTLEEAKVQRFDLGVVLQNMVERRTKKFPNEDVNFPIPIVRETSKALKDIGDRIILEIEAALQTLDDFIGANEP